MNELVDVAVADRVATITLNRPEARNSLNRAMIDALQAALSWFDGADEVDVGVLTAVDPVFCAGLDLKALEPGGGLSVPELNAAGNPWVPRAKPLIGAVNGAAVTGGLELALSCDVLIASEKARFADTHARVGLMPFWGLSVLLPRAVGWRTATMMSITGNFLDADAALRAGLVAAVVPHDELGNAAAALAADVVSSDQAVVRAVLAAYRENANATGAESVVREQERALAWHVGFDAEELARRRQAVTERGRRQT